MKDEYDDRDIERLLKTLRAGPSDHVRESVLEGYTSALRRERRRGFGIGMLARPIPLYVFLLSLIAVTGLSFYSARRMIEPAGRFSPRLESMQEQDSTAVKGMTWTAAQRDLL